MWFNTEEKLVSFNILCEWGNRSFRQRVVSPTVISQTYWSQFANVIKSVRKLVEVSSHMSTCVLTIRFAIFGFEIKRYKHLYVNPDVNLGANYTIQNTTLHVVCVNYWIWNIENILFLAKVYFIIKWKVDDSPHWLQVDWKQADRHFEVSLFMIVCPIRLHAISYPESSG